VHGLDRGADDGQGVAGQPGAFLRDHGRGEHSGIARRQLGGGRRGALRALAAAPDEPAAGPPVA
jgi:hypothetical protein